MREFMGPSLVLGTRAGASLPAQLGSLRTKMRGRLYWDAGLFRNSMRPVRVNIRSLAQITSPPGSEVDDPVTCTSCPVDGPTQAQMVLAISSAKAVGERPPFSDDISAGCRKGAAGGKILSPLRWENWISAPALPLGPHCAQGVDKKSPSAESLPRKVKERWAGADGSRTVGNHHRIDGARRARDAVARPTGSGGGGGDDRTPSAEVGGRRKRYELAKAAAAPGDTMPPLPPPLRVGCPPIAPCSPAARWSAPRDTPARPPQWRQ